MARPLLVGNWKMNTTRDEAVALAEALRPGLDAVRGLEVVVCPPYVWLSAVRAALVGSFIEVGAQNVNAAPGGAHTGEVSAAMLRSLCTRVIVGHSERRRMYGETDAAVAAKTSAALAAGLRPVVCVGESLETRERGRAEEFVSDQLRASLAGVGDPEHIAIGYEPVWAIGAGRAATPDACQAMAAAVRGVLTELYGEAAAGQVPILYGGSVDAANARRFAECKDIDGALVGGASLDAAEFVRIAEVVASVLSR